MGISKQVFFVHGSDTWLHQQHCRNLAKQWMQTHPQATTETLTPPHTPSTIRSALNTLSFFSTARIIVVEEAQGLLQWDDTERAQLTEIHQLMEADVRVIYRASKDLGKSAAAKNLLALGQNIPCTPLTEWQQDQCQKELVAFAKTNGKTLQGPATALLQAWLGTHRASLYSELSKAITYVGDRSTVTESDIAAVSTPSHVAPFALTDALLQKNRTRFFSELSKRLNDDYPLALISLLAGQFRLLLELWDHTNPNPAAIAAQLGKSEFVLKKMLPAKRHWPASVCASALAQLHRCDVDLKTGCNDPAARLLLACSLFWPNATSVEPLDAYE